MKYLKAQYIDDRGEEKIIDITNLSETQIEHYEDRLYCPENGCQAKLYPVHNSYNGGKSVFFRATNENHKDDCPYKNENYKSAKKTVSLEGIFTDEQINTYVRNLHRDLTNTKPNRKDSNKSKNESKKTKRSSTKSKTGADDGVIFRGGKVVSGHEIDDAQKGRMSRRYQVERSDLGAEVGVYGNIKEVKFNKYGEVRFIFEEERYENIEVLIGRVYKNLNETQYMHLDTVVEYVNNLIKIGEKSFLVSAGLVTEYNNQLTIELQAEYSFRINGLNITSIRSGKII